MILRSLWQLKLFRITYESSYMFKNLEVLCESHETSRFFFGSKYAIISTGKKRTEKWGFYIMKKEVMVDMTSGRIAPQILRFAMPVLLGLVFQRIYNFADSYIVGHFLGDNALAAVSVAGVGMYLVFSLIIGLTTGVTVVMSQYYGAKEEDKVVKTFFSSIFIALGMTILVTVIGLLTTRPLLIVLQTPAEVLDAAVLYLRIICAGSVGTMLYNWISAVLRSLGNSVVPLIFLGISSLLNIVFDILFVAVIPMGVGGAAFATVLAQIISGVACLLYAWKILPMLRIRRDKLKLDTYIGKQMLVYGLPAALQMSIISISDMTLQAVVNTERHWWWRMVCASKWKGLECRWAMLSERRLEPLPDKIRGRRTSSGSKPDFALRFC